jgi:hypothetical protein
MDDGADLMLSEILILGVVVIIAITVFAPVVANNR